MKFKFAVIFLLIFSANPFAQNPSTILKQAEKSHGGKKNLSRVNSYIKRGLITRLRDGMEGEIRIEAVKPVFYHIFIQIEGFENESAFNGKSAWRRDSREGLQTLVGKASGDFQTEATFRNNLWLDYKKTKIENRFGRQDSHKRKICECRYFDKYGRRADKIIF